MVLDPPGLAKRREGLATALRAYHELNLRALKCLQPEGLLVTCSCSGKLSREAFEEMVLSAAEDAQAARCRSWSGAGRGWITRCSRGLPETEYLKALYLRVLEPPPQGARPRRWSPGPAGSARG